MIPAMGYEVSFQLEGEEKPRWVSERVVAWADDGTPLIARALGLGRADEVSHIYGHKILSWEVEEEDVPLGVIPGGDWRATFESDNGEGSWTEPVVAWLVRADGSGEPLVSDSDGCLDKVPTAKVKYWHPDGDWHPDSA